MLVLLSPSKSLDYDNPVPIEEHTTPQFLDDAEELIEVMRGYSRPQLQKLMDISEKLAELNYNRYRDFETPFSPDNARQAIFAFTGDVYRDFRLDDYDTEQFAFLQDHVRILSGLYGLLRPLDLMQAYRLEMGTKLKTDRGESLYDFWGASIAEAINAAMDATNDEVVLNLASNEYFRAVGKRRLNGRVLNVKFKDLRGDTYRTISFYLKRLRGTMTDYMVRHRITDPEGLKEFNELNYYFSEERSSDNQFVFLRDEKP